MPKARLFFRGVVNNLFNLHGIDGFNTTVQTASSNSTYIAFNPFTETPVQGVHWDFGPEYGKVTGTGQLPDAARVQLLGRREVLGRLNPKRERAILLGPALLVGGAGTSPAPPSVSSTRLGHPPSRFLPTAHAVACPPSPSLAQWYFLFSPDVVGR